jgi:Zinc knuckle
MHSTGVRVLTEDSLLNEAERLYMDLYACGKWEVGNTKNQESIFFNGPCFNCGKEGHRARDCRAPKREGGHCPNPPQGRGGRGFGRGLGGYGRGRGRGGGCQGRGGGCINPEQGAPKSPYAMPPKPGEPHEKQIVG